jgi:protein-disulfide isomerase
MTMTRRRVLGAMAAGTAVLAGGGRRAAAQESWYPVQGDDGKPVANMRLPVELTQDLDHLPGIIWIGASSRANTLVELYDYNCPYCRRAAQDLPALLKDVPDLRLGLLNNPILSPQSAAAAKVELALLKTRGPAAAYDFHRRLFQRRGLIDGSKALEVAEAVGVARTSLEAEADGPLVEAALKAQMRLARSLGASATPSYVVAGAGVFGYPGPKALRLLLAASQECGAIAC